eukprot:GDKJ01041645.1.p1 GENE.GDKJ01041645.1~~GDKJ01041645.1.p1  ORF type:complete len:408 (-),score=73.19 GDKJ01041645.1:291-1514(-)
MRSILVGITALIQVVSASNLATMLNKPTIVHISALSEFLISSLQMKYMISSFCEIDILKPSDVTMIADSVANILSCMRSSSSVFSTVDDPEFVCSGEKCYEGEWNIPVIDGTSGREVEIIPPKMINLLPHLQVAVAARTERVKAPDDTVTSNDKSSDEHQTNRVKNPQQKVKILPKSVEVLPKHVDDTRNAARHQNSQPTATGDRLTTVESSTTSGIASPSSTLKTKKSSSSNEKEQVLDSEATRKKVDEDENIKSQGGLLFAEVMTKNSLLDLLNVYWLIQECPINTIKAKISEFEEKFTDQLKDFPDRLRFLKMKELKFFDNLKNFESTPFLFFKEKEDFFQHAQNIIERRCNSNSNQFNILCSTELSYSKHIELDVATCPQTIRSAKLNRFIHSVNNFSSDPLP